MSIGAILDDQLGFPDYRLIMTGAGYEPNKNEHEFEQIAANLDDVADVTATHKYTLHEYERRDLEQQDIFSYDFEDNDVLCVPSAYRSRQPENHKPIERYEQYLEQLEETSLDAILFMDVDNDMDKIPGSAYTKHDLTAQMKRQWNVDLLDIRWESQDTDLLLACSYEL
ncbi:MAG: hypothetical protein MUP66_01690 [Candidatus Nanohaloarchaeota archaeon QJJ-5]|nr:hypothetical protein [Candidatus Nanohaloarchaeota archaeon QJJ-5]